MWLCRERKQEWAAASSRENCSRDWAGGGGGSGCLCFPSCCSSEVLSCCPPPHADVHLTTPFELFCVALQTTPAIPFLAEGSGFHDACDGQAFWKQLAPAEPGEPMGVHTKVLGAAPQPGAGDILPVPLED